MSEQIIRDFYGKIVAKIEVKPNGDKTIRDFNGKILGRYDKMRNVTVDFCGKIICNGDGSGMLFNK